MPTTRSDEIEQLKTIVDELRAQLAGREERAQQIEVEELRSEIEGLRAQMVPRNQGGDAFKLPDPFKYLSEFAGNKKELSAWIEEVDELFDNFKVKNQDGGYSLSSLYIRAIKNKIKGEARTLMCANGNPNTISGIKKILIENYGDDKDFITNLSTLFRMRKGDKTHNRFYHEMKEANIKLKANLQSKPLTGHEIIDIITVAKYLDNIPDPLGSIIRNSKPNGLEEAHQAVLLNQNAETRSRPQPHNNYSSKSKPFKSQGAQGGESHQPQHNTLQPNTFHKHQQYKKPLFQPRPRAETHNNEVEEITEPEPLPPVPVEVEEHDDLEYSDDELNFQTAKGRMHKT